ncbi:hypothetical protein SUGI_1035930 [Cryptomeria japonica]|uniref:probable methyltransferase At1g29790 n=1 Tax=Cryptomeria japonica TaxID=3369 RepID=UPI002414C80C|nr:probable methyltransferase At1g29790 [Cryptomeria japonica]GLJ49104.1 hypothetical protein SUGI_1035930 [Cryptomeria japonica]
MSSEGHAKRKAADGAMSAMTKFHFILLIMSTNLATLFLFTYPNNGPFGHEELIANLIQTRQELMKVQAQLQISRKLSEAIVSTKALKSQDPNDDIANDPWVHWGGGAMPRELMEFISPKKLPRGYTPNIGSDTIYPSVGQACALLKDDLDQYMDYKPGELCPEDEVLAQKLLLRGCEPLPRRRCIPHTSPNYKEPYPFPQSMWTTPPNSSVVWTAYTCKDYACLIDRKNHPGIEDCKDCFDLQYREKSRWLGPGGSIDFTVDEVLALKKGTIRIGLDIGGGTATFAVRMRERNVTIVTTSMNFNGPFNNFIASRGVVPLYITITQRLPFFDNTLDIVHSMHVLSNWIPTRLLEFILYDIYRILRPGGVFWLDHFFCTEKETEIYVPMIANLGFRKLKWSVGSKNDRGAKEVYISALLEKPLQRD